MKFTWNNCGKSQKIQACIWTHDYKFSIEIPRPVPGCNLILLGFVSKAETGCTDQHAMLLVTKVILSTTPSCLHVSCKISDIINIRYCRKLKWSFITTTTTKKILHHNPHSLAKCHEINVLFSLLSYWQVQSTPLNQCVSSITWFCCDQH